MMELLGDIVIRCDSCGEVLVLDKNDFEPETYSYDHGENAMGEEIEYIFQDEIVCSCRNRITFQISGFEYPVGAFNCNLRSPTATGAVVNGHSAVCQRPA